MSDSSKKVSETSSGEVVNGFRSCRDLSDIVPLYTARGVYLKPIAKIHVSINLPQLKTPGKTISTWEVMEKLRLLIRPDEFVSLKVVKSTLEFIRFEGDLGDRSRLQRVLARLDGQRLNLAGFPNVLKVKAAEVKDEFPTRHSWDSYFRDAKHMNELKAGERPDTIHIIGLPVKWFSEDDGKTPSESLVAKIFKRWGVLKRVDVPAADPYRSRMRLGTVVQKFSYEDGIFFDAYIQYIEYMDFIKAMDALRGMKLLKKDKDKNLVASIKVDFDKTKHMSDNSVSHREFERKRLIAQDNLAAEKLRRKQEAEAKKKEELKKKEENDLKGKESRRRDREEKRKRKALTVIRKQEEDKVSLKIAREEKKLIKAQRQLESIRLLDALFDRIKIKVEKNEIDIKSKTANDKKDEKSEQKIDNASKEESNNVKKKDKKEKSNKKKNKKEKKKKKKVSDSEESDSDKKKIKGAVVKSNNNINDQALPLGPFPRLPPQAAWYYNSPVPMLYPPHPPMRGFSRGRGRGGGRGRGHWRDKDNFHRFNAQDYNEQYYKYFANLVGQDYHAFIDSDHESSPRSRSKNRRKSRSGSRSRSHRRRSKSRSRSRSRRDKRSNSRKRTRSCSKTRSRSRSRTRSRTRSRSRSRSPHRGYNRQYKRRRNSRPRSRAESHVRVTRAKSRTTSPRRRSHSSSWSLPKTPERRRSCSWEKSANKAEANGKKTESEKKNTTTPTMTPPSKQKGEEEKEKKPAVEPVKLG